MSAEKTLDILDLFTLERRELTVPQMAELLNTPTSSVYRYLRSLKNKGLVIESREGVYKLGYKFLEYASIIRADSSLSEIALPIMREVTSITGETCMLTIESNLQAVCLEQVPSPEPVKVSAAQGKILPLHAGASSKALLAFLPESKIKQFIEKNILTKFTEKTVISKEELLEELKLIRERGYVVTEEEVDVGTLAYGVPVFNMDNRLVAALSIAGPKERMIRKNEDDILKTLKQAADSIKKCL